MFDIQSYQKAESVSDAIRLLGEDPEARLIAGGTDVLIKLREFEGFSRLVDIHDLPELKPITREADGTVRVGSGASFTDSRGIPHHPRMHPHARGIRRQRRRAADSATWAPSAATSATGPSRRTPAHPSSH